MPVKQLSIEEQILAIQKAAIELADAIKSRGVEERFPARDRPPSRSSIGSINKPDSPPYSGARGLFNRYKRMTSKKESTPLSIQDQKIDLDNMLVTYLKSNQIEIATDREAKEIQMYNALKSIAPDEAEIIKPGIDPIAYIKNISNHIMLNLNDIDQALSRIEENRNSRNNAEINRFGMSSTVGDFPNIQLKDENLQNLSINIDKINSFFLELVKHGTFERISTSIEDVRKAITYINDFLENNQYPKISTKLKNIQPQLTELAAALQLMPPLKKASHITKKF